MNGNLPSTINELWSLFSVIHVKIQYASEPSPGYLDITREFRTPACPPESVLCMPGRDFNATPYIVQLIRTLLERCQSPYRGAQIEGTEVFIANLDDVSTEGCYCIRIDVQGVLGTSLP